MLLNTTFTNLWTSGHHNMCSPYVLSTPTRLVSTLQVRYHQSCPCVTSKLTMWQVKTQCLYSIINTFNSYPCYPPSYTISPLPFLTCLCVIYINGPVPTPIANCKNPASLKQSIQGNSSEYYTLHILTILLPFFYSSKTSGTCFASNRAVQIRQ